jgi:hypothetical protein
VEEEGTGGFWDMRKRIRREGQDQAGIEDGDGDGGGPGDGDGGLKMHVEAALGEDGKVS